MGLVPASNLTPGMKLTRPLVNAGGVVMLSENTELTEALIKKIQRMGVEAVHVQGEAVPLPPAEEVLAELDRRFRNVEKAAHMGVIKKLLKEHIESLYECHGPDNPEK
ncbi:MAG: hypothetical protein ABSE25_11775 [Syntrophorhabdales bacterium]